MEKTYLSAETYQEDCFRLARQVYDSGWRPDAVVALWRGGSVPGMVIHETFDFYGIPISHYCVMCSSYTGIGESGCVQFRCAEEIFAQLTPEMKILVVDDIFDTGRTAACLLNRLSGPNTRFAVVYWKPFAAKVSCAPDYFVAKTDNWIVFPHELKGLSHDEVARKSPVIADILLPQSK